MKNLQFDENDMTAVILPMLTQAHIAGNSHFGAKRIEKQRTGIVDVAFWDNGFEYTHVPSESQLRCLDFIEKNQQEILALLFEYTKNTLYPVHQGFIGDDETSFPKLNSIEDLPKALSVREIYIWQESKEQISYCGLSCNFSGDFEHGTIIIMHKFRILGWEEDLSKEKIMVDLKN